MIETACTCEGLPAHSHIPTHWATVGGVYRPVFDDPYYVRIWVDWRAVARAYMAEELPPTRPIEAVMKGAFNCCCRWGAAIRGEWPEFQCVRCPIHTAPIMAGPNDLCKRHRREASNEPSSKDRSQVAGPAGSGYPPREPSPPSDQRSSPPVV